MINLGVTTAVILVVFTAVYLISTQTAGMRPPRYDEILADAPDDGALTPNNGVPEEIEMIIDISVREERQRNASQLLWLLVLSGIAIEIVVAVMSYYMAEEAIKPVREAYEAQKIFIANASHEIKTPLAAISANLEAADIRNNRWIKNVEKETASLVALNSKLLTLARSDLVAAQPVEEVDVGDIVNEALEILTPRLKKHDVEKKILTTKKIKINRGDFLQLINILLDNAIKYSNKKIIVSCSEHDFSVSNDGTKIAAEDLPRVFDRFYQADKTSDGVGLGLAIAKSLADRNGWKLEASSDDKITTFTLKF